MPAPAHAHFWNATRRLTLGLLAVWLFVSLCVPWFARELDRFHVFGVPLGYWLAAEGALIVYVALIAVYVLAMDRLEAALPLPPVVDGAATGREPGQA